MIFLICVIVTVLVLILLLLLTKESEDKIWAREELQRNMQENPLCHIKYLTGHPTIVESEYYNLAVQNNCICILTDKNEVVATIDTHLIGTIEVVDKSVISERVSLRLIMLLGVWAWAAKQRECQNIFYLVITWQDGQFTHNSVFEYNDSNMPERANAACNLLISEIKSGINEI